MPKSIALDITPTQRANLEKLYAFTSTVKDDDFGMAEFIANDEDFIDPVGAYKDRRHYCGAVACMVGHAPGAGVKPTPKDENDWHRYAANKLGAVFSRLLDRDRTFPDSQLALWTWCFSGDWCGVDNTVAGARARLRIALDQGIPHNYRDQLVRNDPLSYQVAA